MITTIYLIGVLVVAVHMLTVWHSEEFRQMTADFIEEYGDVYEANYLKLLIQGVSIFMIALSWVYVGVLIYQYFKDDEEDGEE